MPKHYDQACPVAKALELVGDRWTLLIVRDLLNEGARRFQDFQQSLKGIAPAILSDRLKLMEEHGRSLCTTPRVVSMMLRNECPDGQAPIREIEDALFDMMFYGVLERYPKLKIVSVENEIGWMPFWLGQCDKAFKRHRHSEKVPMSKLPSEYFAEQIYATFFNDAVGGKLFSWWGVDNCMWSNDYPHQNSTWPNSRVVIDRDMAHLPAADREKLLSTNVRKLYKLKAPASVPKAA
jgi:predicted TIM-barrel fold metal-dependent hydrolase